MGTWILESIDISTDGGLSFEKNKPAEPFRLIIQEGGSAAYSDFSMGVEQMRQGAVWSIRNDSLFYHHPNWVAMDGKTEALIVKCTPDSLILEENSRVRWIYSKNK